MWETKPGSLLTRGRTPLVVKASLPRTFLGLGLFVEIGLLFFGCYLLSQAILQPLESGTTAVLGGAFFLSLATVLLFYLVWPIKPKSMSQRVEFVDDHPDVITVQAITIPEKRETNWVRESAKSLPGRVEEARFHATGKIGT